MELEFKKREKAVGTFIIVVAALLLTTVVLIGRGQDWFKIYVVYYTTFDESYNIDVNTAVKLYKAEIGKVKKITITEDKVRVKLAIQEEYASRIRIDTIATVESPTFLIGNEYVSIKPRRKDTPLIPRGGDITSREKKSIAEVLEEFQVAETSRKLVSAVHEFSEIAHVLRDPDGPLFSIIYNINKVVDDVQAGYGTVGSLLKSRELIEVILARLDQAGTILENISNASVHVPEAVNRVNDNLETLKQIEGGVLENVDNIKIIVRDVEESVKKLKVIVSNIEKGSHDVPEITQSTKKGIQEMRDGMENINKVVHSLQTNFLIRSNIPKETEGEAIDSGLR